MSAGERVGSRVESRVGALVGGVWRVGACVGEGGMAAVYAATGARGERVALKILHSEHARDADLRARFLREAYVANAIGHPGVSRVLGDGVTEDGAAYLVLELLVGETALARAKRMGQLPVDEVRRIASDTLDVLAAAHARGVVHRDVKPDNLFLTDAGGVKLLDFGLARMKSLATEATRVGVMLGTPEYMPPEQVLGRAEEVDARSDIWALGATLFTLATGQSVHDAKNVHELLANATQSARKVQSVAPHLPTSLARVIDRALALDMAARWPSARAMQDALRGVAPSEPPASHTAFLAVPPSSRAARPSFSDLGPPSSRAPFSHVPVPVPVPDLPPPPRVPGLAWFLIVLGSLLLLVLAAFLAVRGAPLARP